MRIPRRRSLAWLAGSGFALLPAVAGAQEEESPRGLVLNAEGASPGYTLLSPLRSRTTYLLDMQGEVAHSWESDYPPGNSVYLLDDGTLLRACRVDSDTFQGGGQGGRLQLQAWDGTVLWDYLCSDEHRMSHHDVEPLPNGNVLVIAWELRTREEAVAAGRDPDQVGERGFWPDEILEIEPVPPDGGKVVWEWHAFDHLVQDFDPDKANFGDVTAHPERIDVNADHRDRAPLSAEERARQEELERQMRAIGYAGGDEKDPEPRGREPREPGGDWLHTNGIDYEPELDLILLSVRHLSEIWILDHSTTTAEAAGSQGGRRGHGGDLLYRWGNPRTYGQGDRSEQQLFGQHDATFVAGNPPHVLVFNNGEGRPEGEFSSVDEIELPFDPEHGFAPPDPAFGPSRPLWSYSAPDPESFYSSFISGTQRVANGNTLICSGVQGRVFEVTPAGEVVWDYLNPFGDVEVDRPGGPRDGPPGGAGGRPDGPPGGPRGAPRGPGPHGLFRATRIAPDHPGLRNL